MAPPSVEYADWFKSQHIDIKKKWLDDVLIKNKNEIERCPGLISVRQLLFEKWKNTKITETTNGTIPNTNQSQPVVTLNSFHVVEVLKYSNISVSSHSQLRKFNENDNFDGDEAEEGGGDWGGGFNFSAKGKNKFGQAKSSRCLELICSDGKSTIYATELESLHIELSEVPGLKLLLKPPITTAKGVLLLKNNNVTVIGGRLIKEEPTKSILLAHLESRYIASGGTPPERKQQDQSKLKALTIDESKQKKPAQKTYQKTVNSVTKPDAPAKSSAFPVTKTTSSSDIRSFFAKKEPVIPAVKSTPQLNTNAGDDNSDFSDDDDFYAALATVNAKKAEKKAQNAAMVEPMEQDAKKDDDEWSDDDDSLFIEAIKSTASTSKSVSKSPQRTTTSMDDSVIIVDSPPQKKLIKSVPPSDKCFLCSLKSYPSRNRIIIHGFIVTLAGKIQLNTAGITVKARVGDGTATKDVLILHEAMEFLFEHKFDRQNLGSEKKTIQKLGKRAQQNIYDFYGKIELVRGDHDLAKSSSSCLSNDEWGIIKLERIS